MSSPTPGGTKGSVPPALDPHLTRRQRLRLWTVANVLTMVRIVLVPAVVLALLRDDLDWYIVAMALIGLGEITDATDGYIARARGEVSDFGRLLDPLADSLARFIVFATLVSLGFGQLWMLLVLFARDMVVAYVRSFAAAHGFVMAARSTGKIKAAFQAGAQGAVLLGIIASRSALAGPPVGAGRTLFWGVTVAAVVLIGGYLIVFRVRGWLRAVLVLTGVSLVALVLWLRYAPPFGVFDERAFAWWPLLVATVVTAFSLGDYVWSFWKATILAPPRDDGPGSGAEGGSAPG